MTLKSKLVLLFTSFTFLAVCVVSIFGYTFIQKEVTKNVNDIYSGKLEALSNKMNGWLNNETQIIHSTASTLDSLGMDEDSLSQNALVTIQNTIKDPNIFDIYVGTEKNGKTYDGTNWIDDTGTYDPRQRPWYTETKTAGKLVITDTYVDSATKKYCLTIAAPLKNTDGSLSGVLGADMYLSTLTNLVANMNLGKAGNAFLIDKNGVALSFPKKNLITKNLTKNTDYKKIITNILPLESGIKKYNLNGASHLMIFKKIPSTGWTLGIILDQKVVYSGINSLRMKYILFAIGIVFFAFIISFLLAQKFTKPIIQLTEISKKMSKGDLTIKTNIHGNGEIPGLANAYNDMSENLRNLVSKIKDAANIVTTASNETFKIADATGKTSKEISSTIEELAKGAVEQAEAVQKGSIMVDEMSNTLHQININAANSTDLAKKVSSAINHGYEAIVNQTNLMEDNKISTANVVEAITLLNEKSQNIEQIVQVISSIASQTNLLALNAAIEAARAGEQGKGFAVVASEVRMLAEQSASSINQITTLLKDIQDRTTESVVEMQLAKDVVDKQANAVNQTKSSFDEIKKSVEEIISQIYEVSSSTSEANKNAQKVTDVIMNIASVAQESAAATEEVATSTEEQVQSMQKISHDSSKLVEEANNLLEEIQKFTI